MFNDFLDSAMTTSDVKKITKMHFSLRQTVASMQSSFEVCIFFKSLVDLCMTATGILFLAEFFFARINEPAVFLVLVLWPVLRGATNFLIPVIFGMVKRTVWMVFCHF